MRRRFLGKSTKNLSNLYLTFDILEDNTEIRIEESATVRLLRYSINGGDFISWNGLSSIIVHKNDVVYFKAAELSPGKFNTTLIITKGVAVRGNLLSISNGIFTSYNHLFAGCNIKSVSKDFLQFTEVTEYCYTGMFARCTSLVNAPELPATTLKKGCYNSMFSGCTSLTTAPALPATTLANFCYHSMFQGCTKLNYIKMLATDISASGCLSYWVYGVASTGTFVKNPDATWDVVGESGVPEGWTVKFDGEEDGGEFYCRCIEMHPMTGAVIYDNTYTFKINGTATWEECSGLYDITHSVYITVYKGDMLSIVPEKGNMSYFPIADIPTTDTIIFGETYTFEY